jgi:hypothetical protein
VIRQEIFTTDLNPPLYFLLLKAWSLLAGVDVLALKSFSAFASVVLIPLTYVLGRRMFGVKTGLIASVLAVLCGAYIWYGAELRMYSLMVLIGAISLYTLFRALSNNAWQWGLAWFASLLIGVSTHFSFVGLAIGQFLLVIVISALRARQVRYARMILVVVLLTMTTAVVLSLSGEPTFRRASQLATDALTSTNGRGISLVNLGHELFNALLFGMNASDPTNGAILLFIALMSFLGVVTPSPVKHTIAKATLFFSIVAPIAFWLVLSYRIENLVSFRYLIYLCPALQILISRTIALLSSISSTSIGRFVAIFPTMLVFASSLHGTVMTYTRTATFQDDWRSFGLALRKEWQPGDAIIINLNTPESVMPYVLGDLAHEVTFARNWLMTPQLEATKRLRSFKSIWYANTGGDDGYQNHEMQLLLKTFLLKQRISFSARTTIIELLKYETNPDLPNEIPDDFVVINEAQQGQTALAAYAVRTGSSKHPNDNFILDVFWRRGEDDVANHTLTVRIGRGESVWLDWSLNAMLERSPLEWTFGRLYRQRYIIPVPPGLPIQPYEIEFILRSGKKGEIYQHARQALSHEDLMCCVRIARASTTEERWRASDVTLASAEYSDVVKPGQLMPVALTWLATQNNIADWQIQLKLETLIGGLVSDAQQNAGVERFTPSVWRAGELTRDQLTLKVPHHALAGWYRLSLRRYRNGVDVDGTLIGFVRVEEYPRTPVARGIQFPTNAIVGDLALLGYSVNDGWSRGKTITVHTYWRTDARPQRDGKLFLHVIGPDGKLVSQDDISPFDNTRSTLTLQKGDGIDQTHRIELKTDLPSGAYTLFAGIYDADGEHARWSAQQDQHPALNDLITLGSFVLP